MRRLGCLALYGIGFAAVFAGGVGVLEGWDRLGFGVLFVAGVVIVAGTSAKEGE
jgi:hypothetical protein